ncbi:MAG TPA: CoA transferase [Stellaceae bacterium]|jgi:crotonobetainyl-CoA:carnitine CoA-transferase CaiB-like acyl-CoA transferase|nr:CoA transferase [Stellaceae bacterium]
MPGPLHGVRVIDLTVAVLGPVATQILGDLGAEIIKVEEPGGEMMRYIGPTKSPAMGAYFLNINRNKKSLALDLKRPAAQQALLRLAGTADVLVHNMRPGAAERCGVSYAAVAAANPRIVYAWASGYRPDGPNRDRAAFDDVIQGESGFAALNRDADGSPRYAPMVIGDKISGYVLASMVGMALYAREKTGRGQEVHVPMFDTMAAFNLVDHLWHGVFGEPEKGLGYPRMLTPHRRPYATTDGHLCLLATTDRQWRNLFGALGHPERADDPRFHSIAARTANIDALYTWLAGVMKTRSTGAWKARLDAADVPNGIVNDLMGVVRDPYLNEAGFFQAVDHPSEGRLTTMPFPVSFSDTRLDQNLPPARLGEHNTEILGELGYSAEEIAALVNQG